ncbi:hypothetical protein WA026_021921, partial [Henosepilachna vigintioctopunctata]
CKLFKQNSDDCFSVRECNPHPDRSQSREISRNFSGSIPRHNRTRSRSGLGGSGQQRYAHPVRARAVVLCRRDTDLVSAEHTLRFMVRKLGDLKTPLSEKLVSSMNNRISERRLKATAALVVFEKPNNYQDDLEQWKDNENFQFPSKYLIRK